MTTRLEFIGKDVARRNQKKLLEGIERQYPTMTQAERNEIALVELAKVQPRHKHLVQHLIGADVVTEDPTTMALWPIMGSQLKRVILGRSIEGRRALIDPAGLSRTYVWRASNGWVQEVEDADVDVIRASPARNWFRDADKFGPYRPARAYDLPVKEREAFADAYEAKRFEADLILKPQWRGV